MEQHLCFENHSLKQEKYGKEASDNHTDVVFKPALCLGVF